MKIYIKTCIAVVIASLSMSSCSKDEVYQSSVTRELSMTLDGEPWNIYYGTSNKPLFIYNSDGSFYGNYSTSYRFSLPDGSYKMIATNTSDLITPPTSLNDQIIEQDIETKQVFAVSDPVYYSSGDALTIPLKTRTGMLRLRATDERADRSYSIIKAVISTPVVGYHVGEATPLVGESIELSRLKETAGGGVGYSDDAVLIETNSVDRKVAVRIDYLDADGNLVNSKPFADDFTIMPNDTVEVLFALNNAEEPVIVNYQVRLASESWSESTVYPSIAIEVPEGYTYVSPDEKLDDVFNAMKEDDSVDEIKIFLRANANYSLADATVTRVEKPFSIVGQKPGFGQRPTTLTVKNITMSGNLSRIHFENLNISTGARMFYPRNIKFEIGEISFVNCTFSSWSGSVWMQGPSSNLQHIVHTIRAEGCTFSNFTAGSNAIFNGDRSRNAPVYNWIFRDCVFHGRNFGTSTAILKDLNRMECDLTVTVEGCKFVDTHGSAFTYFSIDGARTSSTTLTVRDNIVSGTGSDATWFVLGKVDNLSVSGNTRTAGYEMKAYGVEAPAESSQTYQELLNQLSL